MSTGSVWVPGSTQAASTNLFDSIAALRANIASGLNTCLVISYYGSNAIPLQQPQLQGNYYIKTSDTTSADNGGTIIVDAVGNRWYLSPSNSISIDQFGADPTGSTPSDTALAAALASGSRIRLTSGAVYKFSTMQSYTGPVFIEGNGATVLMDGIFLKVINGTGSRVKDINFMPVTTAYTILRNPSVWTATPSAVVKSLTGYMPTSQDTDIWSGLSTTIKNQTAATTALNYPGILFTVSSATGASNVDISGITGYLTSIILQGYSDSTVHKCNFGGGNCEAGIVFYNALSTDFITGSALGFTLPRGVGNKASDNVIKYSSYCGVAFYGNDGYSATGNRCSYNGESGIKTYQYNGTNPQAVACTDGVISGNFTYANYYDGIDAGTVYGVSSYLGGGTSVTGNVSFMNRATGITTEGCIWMVVSGNTCTQNGSMGINGTSQLSSYTGNTTRANSMFTGSTGVNNQWGSAQSYEIQIDGDANTSSGNNMHATYVPNTYGYVHAGALGANPNTGAEGSDSGNSCFGAPMFVSPNIPTDRRSVISFTNVQAGNGKIDSGASVTIPALNTYVTVLSSTTGIVVMRDNTSGGIAVYTFDPLGGAPVAITNSITGLAVQSSGGNFNITVTSGTAPRNIGYLALLSQ